jgi:heme/copper-type cytochrome/quinol oxidase subunit 4
MAWWALVVFALSIVLILLPVLLVWYLNGVGSFLLLRKRHITGEHQVAAPRAGRSGVS